MFTVFLIMCFREVVVTVKGDGEACEGGKTRIQPATPTTLSQNSVKQTRATNEAPDIILIACKCVTSFSLWSKTSLNC